MLLLVAACTLWISPEEAAAHLAELSGETGGASGGDSGGDTGGGETGEDSAGESGGESGDSGGEESDYLTFESVGSFTFVGGNAHATFSADADQGALSRLVYCGPLGGGGTAEVLAVEDPSESQPDDRAVYDQDAPETHATRGGTYESGATFLLPVSPDYPAPDGVLDYDFLVTAPDVPFDCYALTRYGPTAATGALVVQLIVSSESADAADLSGDSSWQGALQRVEEAFDTAGIDLSLVWVDGSSSLGCPSEVAGAADAEALAACASAPGVRQVVVGLVDYLGPAWREPGGTYGMSYAPGLSYAGFGAHSVAVLELGDAVGENRIARIIAHHLGHLLGLYDLHGYAEDLADPLADTPACTSAGTLDLGDCESGAPDNLMWPIASDSAALVITDDQAWVLRRNIAVTP